MEKEIPAYGDLCHGHQLPSRWGRKGEQTSNNERDSHVKKSVLKRYQATIVKFFSKPFKSLKGSRCVATMQTVFHNAILDKECSIKVFQHTFDVV